MDQSPAADSAPARPQTAPLPAWLAHNRWLTFVLPFAIFLLVNALEPTEKGYERFGFTVEYSAYPLVYTLKIALTMVALAVVWPGIRQFPLRVSPLSILVGVVGVAAWIGLCKLQLSVQGYLPEGLTALVELGQRSAYNPLRQWPDDPALAYGLLAIRLWGLAIIVPVIEEFFLRGFVMRFVVEAEWWNVPFGTLTRTALAVGTLLPILMHPVSEVLAVVVWFSLITWLMAKTRNIWDCVAAHVVTNLLLGIYVIIRGEWQFW